MFNFLSSFLPTSEISTYPSWEHKRIADLELQCEKLRLDNQLKDSQIKRLANEVKEAKRRNADGKFKKIEGDFLTR